MLLTRLTFIINFFLLRQSLNVTLLKIPLSYGNQCLQNLIHEQFASSSANLMGKIEVQPLVVLVVRLKLKAINAAEQKVSGLGDNLAGQTIMDR